MHTGVAGNRDWVAAIFRVNFPSNFLATLPRLDSNIESKFKSRPNIELKNKISNLNYEKKSHFSQKTNSK